MKAALGKLRKASKFLLFALLPAVVFLLLAEAAVRARYFSWSKDLRFLQWGLGGGRSVQGGPEKAYELPPGAVVVGPDAPGGVRTNRFGLRGRDFDPQPPPATLRIIAFGGSSVWGVGNRDGETWPEQLEAKLSKLYAPQRFEVVNGATAGGKVADARRLLAEQLKGHTFHIGILYFGRNNLAAYFQTFACKGPDLPIPGSIRLLNAVSDRVLFFLVLREKLSLWTGKRLEGVYRPRPEEWCIRIPPEELKNAQEWALMSPEERTAIRRQGEVHQRFSTRDLEEYVDDLRGLVEEGKSRAMKFLYIRQAHVPHFYHPTRYMPFIWEVTEEAIAPFQVPSFDMYAHFKKAGHPEELFQNYPKDGIHLTAQGNALVADGLIEAFRNLSWIPPR